MSDIRYSVWLSLAAIPGTKSLCQLIEAFDGDTDAIYRSTHDDFVAKGANEVLATRLCDKDLTEALKIIDFCQKRDVFLLPYDSPNYPKRLRRIPDFPVLLYGRGALPTIDNEVAIATVGTRRYTEYGQQNAYVISRDMARAGAVVVSGMASGIDTFCHRGALDALGYTIAVLGCGIDVVYPKSNRDLMEEIAQNGTVLTEYPPHTEPAGYHFPKRNRIISALSLGTLVIEADEKSGAMITARLALEQGRDLFSLPGNIGESTSLGTNRLIKEGARMVTGALDILNEYESLFPTKIHSERLIFKSISRRIAPTPTKQIATSITPIKNDRPRSENGVYRIDDGTPVVNEQIPTAKARKSKPVKQAQESCDTPVTTPSLIPADLKPEEKRVLEVLPRTGGATPDEISRNGIPVAEVLVALTMLEIRQLVKSLPGGLYIRTV